MIRVSHLRQLYRSLQVSKCSLRGQKVTSSILSSSVWLERVRMLLFLPKLCSRGAFMVSILGSRRFLKLMELSRGWFSSSRSRSVLMKLRLFFLLKVSSQLLLLSPDEMSMNSLSHFEFWDSYSSVLQRWMSIWPLSSNRFLDCLAAGLPPIIFCSLRWKAERPLLWILGRSMQIWVESFILP